MSLMATSLHSSRANVIRSSPPSPVSAYGISSGADFRSLDDDASGSIVVKLRMLEEREARASLF